MTVPSMNPLPEKKGKQDPFFTHGTRKKMDIAEIADIILTLHFNID